MHCWVCDQAARQLSDAQRAAVAEYVSMVAGGVNKVRADIKMNGCEEIHPAVEKSYEICLDIFKNDPRGPLLGQDILRKGPHLALILETMGTMEQEHITKYMKTNPDATSLQIWNQLEQLGPRLRSEAKSFKEKAALKLFLKDIVIQYTHPRLDINVSKQMNHLLKAPFVVHPKTGRVCVPIDPATMDAFDPADVPTIGKLVDELNRGVDVRHTSMRAYTHFFEESFLKPLERDAVEDMSRGSLDW